LKMGEKPMVMLFGKRLIDYVITALDGSDVDRIIVAATENVPNTMAWAEERSIEVVDTPSRGFVADMICGVKKAEITDPLLVIMADLPLVTSDLIDEIIDVYKDRPEPALSTHTPLDLHRRLGRRPDSLFN
jgi:adenosylcobinamide-phosphate guanylyltransferase